MMRMIFLNNFYEIKLRFQDFMSCVYGRMHLADYIHLWFLEIVFIRGRCSKREDVYWKIYRTGKSIWILYIYILIRKLKTKHWTQYYCTTYWVLTNDDSLHIINVVSWINLLKCHKLVIFYAILERVNI